MSKEAMKRISDKLKKAGATLPAPQATGTIKGSMITGLCIALAIVEQEIEALAEQPAQQEPVPWSQALEDVWAEPDDTTPQPAQQEPVALSWVNDDGFLRKKPSEQTAKQKPIAWIWEGRDGYATIELIDLDEQDMQNVSVKSMTPLYTSQLAHRKPLTFSKLCDIEYEITHRDGDFSILNFARAVEAAHGIKENT